MCLAIPGKILSFDDDGGALKMAKVDFAGVTKKICVDWVPDVKIGEYVLVHVGFALNIIDEQQAEDTLRALREMGELLDDEIISDEDEIKNRRNTAR